MLEHYIRSNRIGKCSSVCKSRLKFSNARIVGFPDDPGRRETSGGAVGVGAGQRAGEFGGVERAEIGRLFADADGMDRQGGGFG